MSKEAPRQYDMFSGELVDNRTAKQRRDDKRRDDWQQMQMFTLAETYEMGVSARPWLKHEVPGPLALEREDHRTPEEVEADLMREAEALTVPMFEEPKQVATKESVAPEGLRARMRREASPVRRRSRSA